MVAITETRTVRPGLNIFSLCGLLVNTMLVELDEANFSICIFFLDFAADNDAGALTEKFSASEIALTKSNEQNCRTPQKKCGLGLEFGQFPSRFRESDGRGRPRWASPYCSQTWEAAQHLVSVWSRFQSGSIARISLERFGS